MRCHTLKLVFEPSYGDLHVEWPYKLSLTRWKRFSFYLILVLINLRTNCVAARSPLCLVFSLLLCWPKICFNIFWNPSSQISMLLGQCAETCENYNHEARSVDWSRGLMNLDWLRCDRSSSQGKKTFTFWTVSWFSP